MKRRMRSLLFVMLLVLSLSMTAFAAGADFQGKIWTDVPKIFGIGYYCTAARNDSGGSTIHKAEAWSYDEEGFEIAHGAITGNSRAVANSGKTKPNSGFGTFWEEDAKGKKIESCVATASFGSDAYT